MVQWVSCTVLPADVYRTLACRIHSNQRLLHSWYSTCLCAPCFAAIGAIKREMNNAKWTWFAIGYQCGFAYCIALVINQIGNAVTGNLNIIGLIAAIAVIGVIIYNLVRPYKEAK